VSSATKAITDWVHACACAIGCGLDAWLFDVTLEVRDDEGMEVEVKSPYAHATLSIHAAMVLDPERLRRYIAHELGHCLVWDLEARNDAALELFCDRFAFLTHDLMPMPPSLDELGLIRALDIVPGSADFS
jgi:hypothetical protein